MARQAESAVQYTFTPGCLHGYSGRRFFRPSWTSSPGGSRIHVSSMRRYISPGLNVRGVPGIVPGRALFILLSAGLLVIASACSAKEPPTTDLVHRATIKDIMD